MWRCQTSVYFRTKSYTQDQLLRQPDQQKEEVLIKLKEVRICSIVIGQTEARRHFQVLESISKGIEAPERKDSRTILHDYLEVRRNPREATPPPSIPRILLGYIHTQKMRSATEHLKKRHTNRGHENERNERWGWFQCFCRSCAREYLSTLRDAPWVLWEWSWAILPPECFPVFHVLGRLFFSDYKWEDVLLSFIWFRCKRRTLITLKLDLSYGVWVGCKLFTNFAKNWSPQF
jgi:hypothetical protein